MRKVSCTALLILDASVAQSEPLSIERAGLTYDPQSAALKQSLSEAKQAQSRPQRGAPGNMFGPEFMAKLHMNPQTRPLLSQPDFMAMLQDMGKNPANMSKYLGDSRLQQALSVGLGINMMSGDNFKKEQGMNGAGASATADEAVEEDDDDDSMPVSCLSSYHVCTGLPAIYQQLIKPCLEFLAASMCIDSPASLYVCIVCQSCKWKRSLIICTEIVSKTQTLRNVHSQHTLRCSVLFTHWDCVAASRGSYAS